MINFIVAMDKNNLIGKDNNLPWRLPEDLKYFKQSTLNHSIVMGRKTFDSLPGILPNRKHLVLTTKNIKSKNKNVIYFNSLEEILDLSKKEDLFVIGGAEIFKQFLPFADRVFITYIDKEFEGDTYFPSFDKNEWKLISSVKGIRDEKNPYDYYYNVYERIEK